MYLKINFVVAKVQPSYKYSDICFIQSVQLEWTNEKQNRKGSVDKKNVVKGEYFNFEKDYISCNRRWGKSQS